MHFSQRRLASFLGGLAFLVGLCTIMVVAQSSDSTSDEECCRQPDQKVQEAMSKINVMKPISNIINQRPQLCSAYQQYDTGDRTFERVPIYPGLSKVLIANCKRVEITNPGTGVVIEVPSNSLEGRKLIVKGTLPHDQFRINFAKSDSEVFLHIAVRPHRQQIGRNDYFSDWGEEENHLDVFPFTIGSPFMMAITADDVGFHCEVGGRRIFTFNHRHRPLTAVKKIVIDTVHLSEVTFN